MDLVIRNATLPDGRHGIDIAIDNGRIADVAPALQAKGLARSMPRAISSHRLSSMRIFIWMPRSVTASRA